MWSEYVQVRSVYVRLWSVCSGVVYDFIVTFSQDPAWRHAGGGGWVWHGGRGSG